VSEEQIGERRRRREAERAAQAATGPAEEGALTRREIRAREAALQTGELKIDDTGMLQVIKEPEPRPEPDPDGPATGAIGLTRRQLRELREQQAAAAPAASPAAPEPAGGADSGGAEPPSTPQAPDVRTEPTPARGVDAAPQPPVRRPVVRPPASAGGVRSLTEDGAALAPVSPRAPGPADPSSPTEWTASSTASVDVTGSLPQIDAPATRSPTTATRDHGSVIVPDPGPLPTTRRTRRVVDAAMQDAAAAETPSIDALIAGENEEPETFDGTPSWVELPPPTPASPMPAVALATAESVPDAGPGTEVIRPTDGDTASVPAAGDDNDVEYDDEDDDDHRTPGWLTALMVLVLVVIAIVLGLLVWRMVQGDGGAVAAVDFWQGGTVRQETTR